MENKKLYIGLGVLAVAGIGYYMWKKHEEKEKSKSSSGDKKSNATGALKGGSKVSIKPNIQEKTYAWECKNASGTVVTTGYGTNSTGGCPTGTVRKDLN